MALSANLISSKPLCTQMEILPTAHLLRHTSICSGLLFKKVLYFRHFNLAWDMKKCCKSFKGMDCGSFWSLIWDVTSMAVDAFSHLKLPIFPLHD